MLAYRDQCWLAWVDGSRSSAAGAGHPDDPGGCGLAWRQPAHASAMGCEGKIRSSAAPDQRLPNLLAPRCPASAKRDRGGGSRDVEKAVHPPANSALAELAYFAGGSPAAVSAGVAIPLKVLSRSAALVLDELTEGLDVGDSRKVDRRPGCLQCWSRSRSPGAACPA